MDNEEMIKNLGDMVGAVEKLTKPTQDENVRLHEEMDKMHKQLDKMHKQMWWERIVFGILLLAFIAFAYLTPVTVDQGQDFEGKTQTQSYIEGATSGE